MEKFSLCALVYTNADGKKIRLKAHKVFNDASSADIKKWEKEGRVRDATVGEVAEAVAAGDLDPKALPKRPSTQKTDDAAKKAADPAKKAADPAKPESKSDGAQTAGKSDGAQTAGDGAPKRQDIV